MGSCCIKHNARGEKDHELSFKNSPGQERKSIKAQICVQ